MSEATRSIALTEAVKMVPLATDFKAVIEIAEAFNTFLQDSLCPDQVHSSPQPAKAEAAKPKKNTAAKAAAKTEAQLAAEYTTKAREAQLTAESKARVAATEAAVTVTKQDVATSVELLLKANKREEAKALLKKFGANSVSSVPEDDYEAFVTEAKSLLTEEDMTA